MRKKRDTSRLHLIAHLALPTQGAMKSTYLALCLALSFIGACDDEDDNDSGTSGTTSGGSNASSGDSQASSATSSTSESSTSTNSGDNNIYVNGGGTVDGMTVTFACDSHSQNYEFYSTQKIDPAGGHLLGLACNKNTQGLPYSLNIGVLISAPKSDTVCMPNTWGIQLVDLGVNKLYNCALDGTTSFLIDVKEYSVDSAGAVTWGGDYQVTGDGMTTDVDLAGSFRVVTPVI